MPLAYSRYAEAFIDLAAERNDLDGYLKELTSVNDICSDKTLNMLLINPEVSKAERKNVLSGILKGRVLQEILNFVLLLIDKERIGSLPGILRESVRLANERRKIMELTIYTAFPITQDQIDTICGKFKNMYAAADVKVTVTVDPSLIGGIKVVVGDKVYDGSVRKKLAGLRKNMVDQQ
ncbi:MAG TPA: F0F1 ATP synthase subunit delta [Clostridia bacterium]|nr:F0F1 ATP synthase subunit delta [Clostridia bacterium]